MGCVEVEVRIFSFFGMGGCVWVFLVCEGRVKDEGGNKIIFCLGFCIWVVFVSDGMKCFCIGFDVGLVGLCCLLLNVVFEEFEKNV